MTPLPGNVQGHEIGSKQFGMQDQQIKWALAGVLNDPSALASALRTWVEQP